MYGHSQSSRANALYESVGAVPNFGAFLIRLQAAPGGRGGDTLRSEIAASLPSAGGNELAGIDGGFLVPYPWSAQVLDFADQEGSFLPLCENLPVIADTGGNSVPVPGDREAPWGTTGITASWTRELSSPSQVKPYVGSHLLRLHKLQASVPISNDLDIDSGVRSEYLARRFGATLAWNINEALLWGSGQGQPLGCLVSPAAVIQAKEAGQTTGTLVAANLTKMISRMPADSYGRAVWLMNSDTLAAALSLGAQTFPMTPATGDVPVGTVGILYGRPLVVTQHAPAFSSQGDVSLVDFRYMVAVTKTDGPTMAKSLHLYFDADVSAYRLSLRIDAQPRIHAPLPAFRGSTTLSPFVLLAAR